jgi:hypothetical protein
MLLRNVVFASKKALAVAASILHMTLVETAKAEELYTNYEAFWQQREQARLICNSV